MDPLITVRNLTKYFGEKPYERISVLENIDFEVLPGEIFMILGPSGSGKSTLLRIITDLEKTSRGEVKFTSGIDKTDISFVFQQFALLPWLTVFENIELPLIARNINSKERKKRVEREIKTLGLEKFSASHPRELSGGMKQRVGIARALINEPKIIFMDEPFSELDSFTAEAMRQELLTIWQERKPTIIMVTHNIEEAIELGDKIAVFSARPGKIEKIINNTISRPRNKRSSEFYKMEDELLGLIKP